MHFSRSVEEQLANMECNATSAVAITHHFVDKMVGPVSCLPLIALQNCPHAVRSQCLYALLDLFPTYRHTIIV